MEKYNSISKYSRKSSELLDKIQKKIHSHFKKKNFEPKFNAAESAVIDMEISKIEKVPRGIRDEKSSKE